MSRTRTYAIEHSDLSQQAVQALDRAVLARLAPRATTVETDLPLHEAGSWPADVEAAAPLRLQHSNPKAVPDEYCYSAADVRTHRDLWDAVVLVAPYASDAEVRETKGE